MSANKTRAELVAERDPRYALLCTQVSPDGLKCGDTWPRCVNIMGCVERGCYWRRWHGIPPDKMKV